MRQAGCGCRSRTDTVVIGQDQDETDRVAPELIELFIEETGEEIEIINRAFSDWAQDENEQEALINLRRSFHTLKGSGHVVGATLMGEFCWSVENLLNRIIDGTVERAPELVEILQQAVKVLPEVLEQLEVGTVPQQDVQALMTQAEAFATGKAAVTRPVPPEDKPETVATGDAADEPEPSAADATGSRL